MWLNALIFDKITLIRNGGGGYYTYFGYGDVPSGRVSIFMILV